MSTIFTLACFVPFPTVLTSMIRWARRSNDRYNAQLTIERIGWYA